MRLITTSWNSAWQPEEAERWQLAHSPSLDGHAVTWSWEEWHGRGWHGCGMASVNQTRPHCVNQMGKTHSEHLAARHDMDAACYVCICLKLPLVFPSTVTALRQLSLSPAVYISTLWSVKSSTSLYTCSRNHHHHNHICHGVGPLVDPFRSHVSRRLFKVLALFLLPIGE